MIRSALIISIICTSQTVLSADILVEAESFADKGGWVVDQQFMDQMGSPYLMAHGIGEPVADASTTVEFPETGAYYLYVRTFNWTAPWYKGEGPGRFQIAIDGKPLPVIFGIEGEQWLWQSAGKVKIKNPKTTITLHDLTGFNGRCDALFFTKEANSPPPNDVATLGELRRKLLNVSIKEAGRFDFVVCGAGMAGISAAVTAARLGLKVALISDRPVVGGNSSSEIRVSTGGDGKYLYPQLGKITTILRLPPAENVNAARTADIYGDNKKLQLIRNTPNLELFINYHVIATETDRKYNGNAPSASGYSGNYVEPEPLKITAVVARNIETSEELRFEASLFADCTGDANVGFLAGADWRMGTESRYEYGEPFAPLVANNNVMGASNLWEFETLDTPSSFPVLDWACRFNDESAIVENKPDWRWEGGFTKDPIDEAENVRDQNLRAILGNWAYLKNSNPDYANRKILWLAYISGKRESRRLLGDVIVTQNDLKNNTQYDDASFTTTWSTDLHYPNPTNSRFFPGNEFFSYSEGTGIKPFHVPYRCLYSRNIANLFMAGRNISVSHVALGSVRVQLTTSMMGEVVGMAAAVCGKNSILPRQVYSERLDELKSLLQRGVPMITILAMGDALTEGSEASPSFLFALRRSLFNAGFAVDFIGPRETPYRYKHEKIREAGFPDKTVEYLDSVADSLYRQYPADFVLLNPGFGNLSEEKTTAACESIIRKINAINPNAYIFIPQKLTAGDGVNTAPDSVAKIADACFKALKKRME
ncbi:MAG: FAD-dependent oxidoreductase [Tannerella sp.]|jgi:hypothetical protein|nr:FAD-dependent oxidoreductase [Tannerella sp.]